MMIPYFLFSNHCHIVFLTHSCSDSLCWFENFYSFHEKFVRGIHDDLHYLHFSVHGLTEKGDRVNNNFQQKTTREPVIQSS
jgi:hypothetical protein